MRGIPSVEYGDLTSGLVKVKRREGGRDLTARFKADMSSKLFSVGKGFERKGRGDAERTTLNINADYLARAVAISLGSKKLILMTDVKGVLENGQVLNHLNIVDVQKKIDSGVITGGMIPKIQSAVQTVESGVDQVIIGDNLTDGTIIKE